MTETWKQEIGETIKGLIGRHVRDKRQREEQSLDRDLDDDQAELDDWAWGEDAPPLTVEDSVDLLARAQALGEAEQLVGLERCERCGCTEITPCSEGCGWAASNLCTSCEENRLRGSTT